MELPLLLQMTNRMQCDVQFRLWGVVEVPPTHHMERLTPPVREGRRRCSHGPESSSIAILKM